MQHMVHVSFASTDACSAPYPVPQFLSEIAAPYGEINQYLRESSCRWARNSTLTAAHHLRHFVRWLEENHTDTGDLTTADVVQFCRDCSGQASVAPTGSAATRRAIALSVISFYNWHCRQTNNNSFLTDKKKSKASFDILHILPKRPPDKPASFLSLDDAIRFITTLGVQRGPSRDIPIRNELMARMMLEVGLRVSEVVALRISDIPESIGTAAVAAGRVRGKGDRVRIIAIPNKLLISLWEYIDIYRARRLESLAFKNKRNSNAVFLSNRGTDMTRNQVERLFSACSKAIQIRVTPHLLRHTFATYHYLYHKDLVLLSKLLGHNQIETTQHYYIAVALLIASTPLFERMQEDLSIQEAPPCPSMK